MPELSYRLTPRPRPAWKTDLTSAQFGTIAEDLVAIGLAAAASGSGTVARPLVDRGVDLYLRRLRTLLTIAIQVKACRHVSPDGTVSQDFPSSDLPDAATGYWAMVHVPPPHDQLYRRLYLIPVHELRLRCQRVNSHGVESFRFSANFAGTVQDTWSPFAVDIERLSHWLAAIPGWAEPVPPIPAAGKLDTLSTSDELGTVGMAGLTTLWAMAELERAANGAIMVAEDRIRLDTVTLLAHHLSTGRFAGLHLRTAEVNDTRRTHFEVKRPHFFVDRSLWVLLVLLRPDRRVHDFGLLIPSADIPELGYSETLTLDPLTKRFRKYRIASDEFGSTFLNSAFHIKAQGPGVDWDSDLPMAG